MQMKATEKYFPLTFEFVDEKLRDHSNESC